jgi:hypothetical protein
MNQKSGVCHYSVLSKKDLNNVIIPHFLKYPLLTKKRADFILFKAAIDLIIKGKHLTAKGLKKILSIRASMNKGLTKVLIDAFPNIIPENRPKIEITEIKDPY